MIRPGSLETDLPELTLRRLVAEDAVPYFDAVEANREHLSQFGDMTSKKYPTLESVQDSIVEHPGVDVDAEGNPRTRMGIWSDEQFVGFIKVTVGEAGAEIGYWMDSAYTGMGYATHAVRALTSFAKDHHDVVYATAHAENVASRRVLQKSGYEYDITMAIDGNEIDIFTA
ncbi:MAG: GNAT family N-acetyltransferase [Candidatus Microsaccharimonas sp.]